MTTALNTEFIRGKWIPALRSGRYEQGIGVLRDKHDRFCCLGVVCDVLVQDGLLAPWDPPGSERVYTIAGEAGHLPTAAAFQIGTVDLPLEDDLIEMNDGGFTFAEIADALEAACVKYGTTP